MPWMVTGPTEDGEGGTIAVKRLFPAGGDFSARATDIPLDARRDPSVLTPEGVHGSRRGWGRRRGQGWTDTMRVSMFLAWRGFGKIQHVLLVFAGGRPATLTQNL